METLIPGGNTAIQKIKNEANASSTNLLKNSEMNSVKLFLDIDLNEATTAPSETTKELTRNNQSSLEAIPRLAKNGYYFIVQPKNNRKTGEAYFWVTATKQGEDREEFSLYANNEISNVMMATLIGKSADISGINANELEEFNKEITNFELELFMAERAQGRTMKKTHTTNGQMFSSYYKRGIIVYHPYKNPEFKAYLNA